MELKKTNSGIYYIYEYTPSRNLRYATEENEKISRLIWDYKDGDDNAIDYFTDDFMQAIAILSEDIEEDYIGLVAVPPSKVGKFSPVRRSIEIIKDWYDEGTAEDVYGCEKRIYDYGNLLERTSDVRTSHRGKRASYDEHIESIECIRDRLFRYKTAFILLDDVTTKGTIMDACRDILIENQGKKPINIYRLALARTK